MLPKPLERCIAIFSRFPSMGPRQATRFAFYLRSLSRETIHDISKALMALADLKTCEQCYITHDADASLCSLCSNPERSTDIIMVVERETDVIALEKSGVFKGRYCVLGEIRNHGTLSPQQQLRIQAFRKQIELLPNSRVSEIILALNQTAFKDAHADLLCDELKECANRITRLGRGMPTGGEIEFADEDTLTGALDNRK